MLAGVTAASAHVGVTPDKTDANAYALLTFGIPHGCDESGTTKVTITLPEELNDAQPTVNPNWTVQKVVEQLPEPKKLADGATITKRTSQIVYTAKAPLDPELRDALVLSVKMPDAAGTTLHFPTLQNCEQGQTDWSEIAKEGQDPHSLKAPAPSLTVTAAAADGHGSHASVSSETTAESADAAHASSVSASAPDDGAQARSWAGLVAGFGGLAPGGAALMRGRNRKTAEAPAAGNVSDARK
jgi:uncharacterized protein YcnI